MKTALRHLGYCQICEGEFKLAGGLMVHHGYKRPGWGYIVGDCMGVSQLPYEKSAEVCKVYLARVSEHRADKQEFLRRLEADEVTELYKTHWKGKPELVKKSEAKDYEWKLLVRSRVRETEYEIRGLGYEVDRMEKRIAAWKLCETRTVEERVAEEDRKRAEKAAERAQKRSEKEAKEKAKAERKAALEARKEAARKAVFDKARELAAEDAPSFDEVCKLRRKMLKLNLWAHECKDVTLELKKLDLMDDRGNLRVY